MDSIAYLSDLENDTKTWWKTGDGKLYLLHPVQSHALASIGTSSPRIDATTLLSAIDQCRVIKDDYEIGLIRQANKVSADAHRAVLEKIKSFENESQVEGIFLDTCVSEGAHNQAYNIIAGSGSNASVLHYGKNDEPLAGRQVLLIDAGAEWNCYASDVTRTFPISGTWTKEAKAIYNIVEKMQENVISRLKPGVHYRDMQVLAHVIAANGLLELGILHNGTAAEIIKAGTTLAFFPHGLGHHVGLEVHDVLNIRISKEDEQERHSATSGARTLHCQLAQPDLEGKPICTSPPHLSSNPSEIYATLNDPSICLAPVREDSPTLKEDMVITVEPGLYFSKFALENHFLKDPVHSRYINTEVLGRYVDVGGVRIEDDILITRDGFENLTTALKGEDALKVIRGEEGVLLNGFEDLSMAPKGGFIRGEKEESGLSGLPMGFVERSFRGHGEDVAHPRSTACNKEEEEEAGSEYITLRAPSKGLQQLGLDARDIIEHDSLLSVARKKEGSGHDRPPGPSQPQNHSIEAGSDGLLLDEAEASSSSANNTITTHLASEDTEARRRLQDKHKRMEDKNKRMEEKNKRAEHRKRKNFYLERLETEARQLMRRRDVDKRELDEKRKENERLRMVLERWGEEKEEMERREEMGREMGREMRREREGGDCFPVSGEGGLMGAFPFGGEGEEE